MNHMRFMAAILVVLAAVLAARVDTARACSCVQPDPRTMLPQVDGAFVGKLVRRRDVGAGRSLFTFAVERSVKGGIGRTIEVASASNGAACGIEATVGQRIGLMLERVGAMWRGNMCAQVDPDDLVAAASPLPRPDGHGPAALLVGGRFGAVRTIALDGRGRTLAYGKGAGTTTGIAVCPGSKRVAEAVALIDGWQLAVRERHTLRRIRTRRIALPVGTVVTAIRCEDASADAVLVFASSPTYPGRARLVRIRLDGVALVWRGVAVDAAISDRHAYVATGRRGTRLVRVDLASGRSTSIGRIPPSVTSLRLSPDAGYLAGIAFSDAVSGSPPSMAILVDLGHGPVRVRTSPLDAANVSGDVVWLPNGRLAVLESGTTNDVRIFDRELAPRGRFSGWTGRGGAVVGSTVFGVRWDGRLLAASLPNGPVRVVRRLPGPSAQVLLATPS